MKKLLHLSLVSLSIIFGSTAFGQDVYWRENFTDVTPSSDPGM